ncbi:DUF3333 domain-containing protein, partial [Planktomarina sp.]|nr:DUF3333 domain-containing protein [Planktomarina sp.]
MTAHSTKKHGSLLVKDARTQRRNNAELWFRAYGLTAVIVGILALIVLLVSIFSNGISAFQQTKLMITLELPEAKLDQKGQRDLDVMKKVTTIGYSKVLGNGLIDQLDRLGIATDLKDKDVREILSKESAATLRDVVLADPSLIGTTVTMEFLVNGRIDGYFKGRVDRASAELDKNVKPGQLDIADALTEHGLMYTQFNLDFILAPDASDQRP